MRLKSGTPLSFSSLTFTDACCHRSRDPSSSQSPEGAWEFDTVRGSSFGDSLPMREDSLSLPSSLSEDISSNATIRPPPTKVPPTLRMLFEDDSELPPINTLRFPTVDPSPPSSLLTPTLLTPQTPRSSRGRPRSPTAPTPPDDILTAKQPTFVFPPRGSTPRSNAGFPSASSDNDALFPPLDRPDWNKPRKQSGGALDLPPLPSDSFSSKASGSIPATNFRQAARERRQQRGLQTNIDSPLPSDDIDFDDTDFSAFSFQEIVSTSEPSPSRPPEPRLQRKRSQSSAAEATPTSGGGRVTPSAALKNRTLTSSTEFHFPRVVPGPRSASLTPESFGHPGSSVSPRLGPKQSDESLKRTLQFLGSPGTSAHHTSRSVDSIDPRGETFQGRSPLEANEGQDIKQARVRLNGIRKV